MPEKKDGFQELVSNPMQSLQILESNSTAQMIDVREKWEWDEEHVENSILIPTSQLKEVDFNRFKKDQPLLIMCHTGRRSFFVANKLHGLGFTQAKSMEGGIDALSPEMREKMSQLLQGRNK